MRRGVDILFALTMKPISFWGTVAFGLILLGHTQGASPGLPKFEPDPYWPKPLPNNWILGQVSGVAVDAHDHIWVIHRPRTTEEHDNYLKDGKADCCTPAPAILEFDQAGNVMQAWGGPGQGYDWPDTEHGIFVDQKDNVWVSGNGVKDTNILKFSNSGKFLLQIGRHGKTGGSNDTENVNQAAGIAVYAPSNEVFVADGYGNRRVIVFDADTGAYKRHWGAYGNQPDDSAPRTRVYEGPGPAQFHTVHGVAISNDGIVYVGDRVNNRIQTFRLDGTFLKEVFIERQTTAPFGTGFGAAFSHDKEQRFFYVPDGTNKKVQIVDRKNMEVVGFFGGHGGHAVGDFSHIHSIATDSKGNVYLGEVDTGRRVYRWTYKGMTSQ
jgi:DNA-binding beta-propeller fold protein YncE